MSILIYKNKFKEKNSIEFNMMFNYQLKRNLLFIIRAKQEKFSWTPIFQRKHHKNISCMFALPSACSACASLLALAVRIISYSFCFHNALFQQSITCELNKKPHKCKLTTSFFVLPMEFNGQIKCTKVCLRLIFL